MNEAEFEDLIGHSPAKGCKWTACGIGAASCPFMKGSSFTDAAPVVIGPTCTHEWRQVSNFMDLRFYCVYCLTITEKHITT